MLKKHELKRICDLTKFYIMKKYTNNVSIEFIEINYDYIVVEIKLNFGDIKDDRLIINLKYLYDIETIVDFITISIKKEIEDIIYKHFYN